MSTVRLVEGCCENENVMVIYALRLTCFQIGFQKALIYCQHCVWDYFGIWLTEKGRKHGGNEFLAEPSWEETSGFKGPSQQAKSLHGYAETSSR